MKNKHTHSDEMIRWAGCEDGTGVWYQLRKNCEWKKTRNPSFQVDCKYVVDDEFANERMHFIDGVKIQQKILWRDDCPKDWNREWHDYDTDDSNNINGSYNGTEAIYRIKPKTVFKYQILYRCHMNGSHMLTDTYYESEEDFMCSYGRGDLMDVRRLEVSKLEFNNE